MKERASVKINKDLAVALSVYCKLHGVTMMEFASNIIKESLKDFEEQLKEMRKIR